MSRQQSEPIQAKIQADHPFFGLIEEAYQVFAYPKPMSTDVCEKCCMDPKIESDFFNPSIRDLPLSYVRNWYCGACAASGVRKEIWGYLLPRILEILAVGEDVSGFGPEVSLKRFENGNCENWSKAEWAVLNNFQRKFLRSQIEQEREFLDDTICMFRLAGWPLDELLDQVASAPDPALALRFWNDWCGSGNSVWMTTFWDESDKKTVFDFYTSKALYDRMEALALGEHTDGDLAAKASAVASVIELQANWS